MPLLLEASTTRIPSDKPLTILFLSRKFFDWCFVQGGYSLTTNPSFSKIFSYSLIFSFGKRLSKPLPKTAIVLPIFLYELMCANVSIPIARPLTIAKPNLDNS